jgi:hypothetical protein
LRYIVVAPPGKEVFYVFALAPVGERVAVGRVRGYRFQPYYTYLIDSTL